MLGLAPRAPPSLVPFSVLWPEERPPEQEFLPEQRIRCSLRDFHQPARGLQPLLPPAGGVPDRPVHLRGQQGRGFLRPRLLRETSRVPVSPPKKKLVRPAER